MNDIRGAQGTARFLNRSQEFLDNELKEMIAAKSRVRMTMEEFREKHKEEFESIFKTGNEEEIKAYRALLDADREIQLARGRNHKDLKDKLEKSKDKNSSRIRKLERKLLKLREKEEKKASKKEKKKSKRDKKRQKSTTSSIPEAEEESDKFLLSKFHDTVESDSEHEHSGDGPGGAEAWAQGWGNDDMSMEGRAPRGATGSAPGAPLLPNVAPGAAGTPLLPTSNIPYPQLVQMLSNPLALLAMNSGGLASLQSPALLLLQQQQQQRQQVQQQIQQIQQQQIQQQLQNAIQQQKSLHLKTAANQTTDTQIANGSMPSDTTTEVSTRRRRPSRWEQRPAQAVAPDQQAPAPETEKPAEPAADPSWQSSGLALRAHRRQERLKNLREEKQTPADEAGLGSKAQPQQISDGKPEPAPEAEQMQIQSAEKAV